MTKIVRGAGGGSKPKPPTIVKDNLFSRDLIEFTIGLAEGPIGGLVRGPKSFYADDTPIQAENGSPNFTPFHVHLYHGGAPASRVQNVLGGISSNTSVGLALAQNTPVVRSTPANLRGRVDLLEVRIQISQLYVANSSGDQLENTASFRLSYRASDQSNWRPFVGDGDNLVQIRGKTSGGYIREFSRRVERRNIDWEVRVEKLNPDHHEWEVCELSFESIQCVTQEDRSYDNLAVVRGLAQASDQFASIPTFTGVYALALIMIPSNYDPITRVYNGVWDGTFKLGHTDNPAWVMYDLVMNMRYGFKAYLPQLQADRFSFYEAARWFDELVPRQGAHGYEPRYTFNYFIDQQTNARDLLTQISTSYGALVVVNNANVAQLKLDKAATPVQLFGPESIVKDTIQYQFTDPASRVNDVTVQFMNPNLGFAQDFRRVYDQRLIDKVGRVTDELNALNCLSVYEAERRAAMRMLTSNTEITTITFNTTRVGLRLDLFDLIAVVDPNMGHGLSGRVKRVTGNLIQLRDPLFVPTNVDLTMAIQTNAGMAEIKVRSSDANATSLIISSGYTWPTEAPARAQFSLAHEQLGMPKLYRVITFSESSDSPDIFTVVAQEHNPNKYGDSLAYKSTEESSSAFVASLIPSRPQFEILSSSSEHVRMFQDGRIMQRIFVRMQDVPRDMVSHHLLYHRLKNSGDYQTTPIYGGYTYIENVNPGEEYEFFAVAVNAAGRRSPNSPVVEHRVNVEAVMAPPPPRGASIVEDGNDLILTIVPPENTRGIVGYEIRLGGTSWETARLLGMASGTTFRHLNPSEPTQHYWIKSRNAVAVSASALERVYTLAANLQAPTGWTAVGGFGEVLLNGHVLSDPRFYAFRIYAKSPGRNDEILLAETASNTFHRLVTTADTRTIYTVSWVTRARVESGRAPEMTAAPVGDSLESVRDDILEKAADAAQDAAQAASDAARAAAQANTANQLAQSAQAAAAETHQNLSAAQIAAQAAADSKVAVDAAQGQINTALGHTQSARDIATGAASAASTAAAASDAAKLAAQDAASAASGSATAAASSKSLADAAKTAAETARTGAQTAQTNAQTAKTAAETARTGAQTALASAQSAKTAAETAASSAQGAKTAAEGAAADAAEALTQTDAAMTAAQEAAAAAAQTLVQTTTAKNNAAAAAQQAIDEAHAAANSASAADLAEDNAVAAKALAEAAALAATTAKNTAEGAATTATTQAGLATTAKNAASGSATAAANSATTATTKAGEASTSAGTASTAANTATTKAGEASTSASQAATSASNASSSATQAATSATTAATARLGATAGASGNLLSKNDFEDGNPGQFNSAGSLNSPAVIVNIPAEYPHPLGRTKAIMQTTRDSYDGVDRPLNFSGIRTIRVTGYVLNLSHVDARAGANVKRLDSSQNWPASTAGVANSGTWVAFSHELQIDATGLKSWRPFFQLNGYPANGAMLAYWTDLRYEDITESKKSTEQATAAANSATSAAASATTAGQSAASATTAKNEAETARGAAQTSATNAATSATDAAGAAATASTQAGNAANSATLAGDKATAASNSATTATTKATEAAQSASTATSAKNAAETARSGAETAQSAAVTAKNTAEGAASTATTQATNAAGSATTAGQSATAASGSASTATTKASEAAQSATTATTQATTASTKAGEASTSASQAATSASNAAGSANTASTQANLAVVARKQALEGAKGNLWPQGVFDNTLNRAGWTAGTVIVDPFNVGSYALTQGNQDINPVGANITNAKGRTFRLTGKVYNPRANATGENAHIYVRRIKNDGAVEGQSSIGLVGPKESTNWVSFDITYTYPANSTVDTIYFFLQSNTGTDNNRAAILWKDLLCEDITESKKATDQASAAASSASDAAASSTTAGQQAAAANAAKLAAETARSGAESAQNSAVTAKNTAEGAASTATTQANLAAGSATAAGSSAAAAASSASTATTKANEAGQSATSAQTSANTATTKAGEAGTSATQAATSASNAAGSATAAGTSATTAATARDVARNALISTPTVTGIPNADTQLFSHSSTGFPATLTAHGGYGVDADGPYIERNVNTQWSGIFLRALHEGGTDRVYRVTARIKLLTEATVRLNVRMLDAQAQRLSDTAPNQTLTKTVDGVQTISAVMGRVAGGLVTDVINSSWWDASVYFRFGVYQPVADKLGSMRLYELRVEDVTEADKAARQAATAAAAATAASTSATNAAASATAAGQQATAATTAKTAAETARSGAETAQAAAVTAKNSAEGSASTATTQAGLAATAANNAGNSATAAATSASTATTKATEAGQSATSAQSSASTAATKAGEAGTSASNAATSASSAAGSATAASTSATTAASARDAASSYATGNMFHRSQFEDGNKGNWSTGSVVNVPIPHPTGLTKALRVVARDCHDGRTFSGNYKGRRLRTKATIYNPGAWPVRIQIEAVRPNGERFWPNPSQSVAAGGTDWVAFEGDINIPEDTRQIRVFMISVNPNSNDAAQNLLHEYYATEIDARDVTEMVNAAGSASAAASSASSAEASANAAGQQATAATTAKLAAETAKGGAETARNEAVTAKNDASGSASTATTQAGLAATSATNAGTKAGEAAASATAAATSASTATTKANEAGQSATAANTSKLAAETARGAAETARTQAVQAKDTAQGSATTATTQAGLAATSANAAGNSATAAATSASTASSKATEASQSATAAQTAAQTATTKAGEASNSATAAAQSKTDAAGSASAASTSATTAANAQSGTASYATGNLWPQGNFTSTNRYGWASGNIVTDPILGVGRVLQSTLRDTTPTGSGFQLTNITGRTYRIRGKVLNQSSAVAHIYRRDTSADNTNTHHRLQIVAQPNQTDWLSFDIEALATTTPAIAYFFLQLESYDNAEFLKVFWKDLICEDITESKAAATQAAAAATSATTATAKATEASQSAATATTQANTATTAAGTAGTHATNAASSASTATTKANEASQSAGAAATSANNAGNSATAAAGSASTASTKATEASQSASAASTSANTANTKAGEASTSASQAATSASNAAGSATAAGTSATTAASARDTTREILLASTIIQGRPDPNLLPFSHSYTGLTVASVPAVAASQYGTDTFGAYVVRSITSGWQGLYPRQPLPITPDTVFRVTIRFRVVGGGATGLNVRMNLRWLHPETGASATDWSIFTGVVTEEMGVQEWVGVIGRTAGGLVTNANTTAAWATSRHLRAGIYNNNDAFEAGVAYRVYGITIEDVTAADQAARQAAAASTSATNAAASATAAGQSATSASNNANTATTKAGEASTSAGQAATSATNAAGSASTASSQASLAAGSAATANTKANEAAGSATAAATSATTATTKANEAGQSATSASNSANTATSKANEAAGSATAAATSATTATTKAGEAATSATTATTAANTATTKAGEASTSASQAAQSKTDAAGSASSAATSATTASQSRQGAAAAAARKLNWDTNSAWPWTNGAAWVDVPLVHPAGRTKAIKLNSQDTYHGSGVENAQFSQYAQWAGRTLRISGWIYNPGNTHVNAGWWTRNPADGVSRYETVQVAARKGAAWQKFDLTITIAANFPATWMTPWFQQSSASAPAGETVNRETYVTDLVFEDITDSLAAQTAATAAATSASAASTSATQAGQSATAAQTSATTAATKAGEASTSAAQAAQSKTDAAGSASTASSQATVAANSALAARDTVSDTFPSNFNQKGLYFTTEESNGTTASVVGDSFFTTVEGVGVVYHKNGADFKAIATRGFVAATPGRTYLVEAKMRVTQNNTVGGTTAAKAIVDLRGFDANKAALAYYPQLQAYNGLSSQMATLVEADGWVTLAGTFTVPASPVCAYLRGRLYHGWQASGNGNGQWQAAYLTIRDVTAEVNAAASAAAAATSAATASTKATEAGQSATAAQTSATTASTKAGEASTSATQAATSATNASGSATAAATSATTAANARKATEDAIVNVSNHSMGGRIDPAINFMGQSSTGTPSGNPIVAASDYGSDEFGTYVRRLMTAQWHGIFTRPVMAATVDSVFRVTVKLRVLSDISLRITHRFLKADFSRNTDTSTNVGVYTPAQGVVTLTAVFGRRSGGLVTDAYSNMGIWNETPWFRWGIDTNLAGYSSEVRIYEFFVEDVTAADLAAREAAAASTSATSAAASATQAGQSATAASTSATTAATKAGEASTSASNAATSATNAAGSATAASTSATTAATARDAAQASAQMNLIVNGTFESGSRGTWATGLTIVDVPKAHPLGRTKAGRFTSRTITDAGNTMVGDFANRSYRMSGYFYNPSNVPASLGVRQSNTAGGNNWATGAAIPAGGTDWVYLDTEVTITAPTRDISAYLLAQGANLAGTDGSFVYVTDLRMVDITESKKAAGSATAAATSATQAAASANTAGQQATAATSAKTAAETARAGAETAASTAVVAKNDAETAQSTAVNQAGIASGSASTAGSQASAAANSATTASTKASEAAQSASTAQTAAQTASTKAGEASTSAGNAATSATNAAGSASAASTSASAAAASAAGARDILNKGPILPSTFSEPLTDHWTTNRTGNPLNNNGLTNSTFVAKDSVFQAPVINIDFTSSGHNLLTRGVMPWGSGRIYRLRVRFRVFSTTETTPTVRLNLAFIPLAADFTNLGSFVGVADFNVPVDGSIFEGSAVVSNVASEGVLRVGSMDGATFTRAGIRHNGTSGANITIRVVSLELVDVTQEMTATQKANAASTSATTAATKASEAASSASAAATSATTASTKAGEASTSATNAASSATSASGSANQAATSATTASTTAIKASEFSTGNILSKSTFEDNIKGDWTHGPVLIPAEYPHPLGRTRAMLQTSRDGYDGTDRPMAFTENRIFRISGYVLNLSNTPTRVGFNRKAIDGAQTWPVVQVQAANATSWERFSVEVTLEFANIRTFRPFIQINGNTSNNDTFACYWTDLRWEDITVAKRAEGQATAAATSATAAATSATTAGQQASAAQSSATTAATKAGEASTSASQASSAATNAAGSAATATSAAVTAATAVSGVMAAGVALVPSTFDGEGVFFTNVLNLSDSDRVNRTFGWNRTYTSFINTDRGMTVQFLPGSPSSIWVSHKKLLVQVPGRRYRMQALARHVGPWAGSSRTSLGLRARRTNGDATGVTADDNIILLNSNFAEPDTWELMTMEWDAPTSGNMLCVTTIFLDNTRLNTAGPTIQVAWCSVSDITDLQEARNQAQVASTASAAASTAAAEALASSTVAARMMGGGVSKNPVFSDWTGTYPAHHAVSIGTGVLTKDTTNARYKNAVYVKSLGAEVGNTPRLRIARDTHGLDCSSNPAQVVVRFEWEYISGDLAQSGANVTFQWEVDGTTYSQSALLKNIGKATPGMVQTHELVFDRPATAPTTDLTTVRLAYYHNSTAGSSSRAAFEVRIHRLDFEEVLAGSTTQIYQQAVANLNAIRSGVLGFRTSTAGVSASLELVSMSDPTGAANSAVRIAADKILLDGSVTTRHLNVEWLNGGRISTSHLDVNTMLTLAWGSGLRYGKNDAHADGSDGIFFGTDGGGSFGFAASRTSNGRRQSIKITPASGLQLLNARHFVSGQTVPQVSTYYGNSGRIGLPRGLRNFYVEGIGGGASGGALDYRVWYTGDDDGGTMESSLQHLGGNWGGDTVINIYDGNTLRHQLVCQGGQTKGWDNGGAGDGTAYGGGGAPAVKGYYYGDSDNDYYSGDFRGGNASGSGAGGGGYYRGGGAGTFRNAGLDLSGFANPQIEVFIGGGGPGKNGSYNGTDGQSGAWVHSGSGAGGRASFSYTLSQDIPADVLPVKPTAQGEFWKHDNGRIDFPNLGAGLWVIFNGGSNLQLSWIRVSEGVDVDFYGTQTATFVSSHTPWQHSGSPGGITIFYRFYALGSWG